MVRAKLALDRSYLTYSVLRSLVSELSTESSEEPLVWPSSVVRINKGKQPRIQKLDHGTYMSSNVSMTS